MEVRLIVVVEDGFVRMELIVQLVRVVVVLHQMETHLIEEVLQQLLKKFMDVRIVVPLTIIHMQTYQMEAVDLKKLKHQRKRLNMKQ
jgi:hypothetical protein